MLANYLTPDEVAQRLKVTGRTVYSWLRSDRLHGIKVGRLWRIPVESMELFLETGDVSSEGQPSLTPELPPAPAKTPSKSSQQNRPKKKKRKK